MNVTMAQWLEIVRFELVHQFRRKSNWLSFAVFLLLLSGQMNGQDIEAVSRGIWFNAPLLIAEASALMGLVSLIVIAPIAGDAATRDVETRIEPLMLAAPISRSAYLGGRVIGAFLVIALVLLIVPVGLMLAPIVGIHRGAVGPIRGAAYLQTYFLLLLPNAFIATALLFSLATLMRHTLGSYLGAIVIFATTVVSTQYIGRVLKQWELAKLLNPAGHASLQYLEQTWSPIDLNTRLVGLDGGLLSNRLLWIAIALAALAFTRARFGHGAGITRAGWWQRRNWKATRAAMAANSSRATDALGRAAAPPATQSFGAAVRVRQTLAIVRDSLREIATGWMWLVFPCLAFLVMASTDTMQIRGTPLLPTTGRVVQGFIGPLNAVLVFVVLLAGELVWRERDSNIQSLTDAAPVPDGVRFAGKLIGLTLAILALHALLMFGGLIIQLQSGWYEFDVVLYAKVLFGLALVTPLLIALLALSVHMIANQKHVGHVLVLMIVVGPMVLAPLLGIEHPLLLPGSGPRWHYSAISGFDPFVAPYLWFKAYWATWTLLFALVAGLFAVRGVEPGIRERVRIARHRLTGRAARAIGAALALIVLVGGFVFFNTNILNEYRSGEEGPRRQAEYERRYSRYEDVAQPELVATQLNVEIYPGRRELDVSGVHHLVNRTSRPIDTIHVATSLDADTRTMEFDRPARLTLRDHTLGHRIYLLDEPLAPGDSLQLSWNVHYHPRGFTAHGIVTAVVGNGTFVQMHDWMPLIGYQSRRELSDPIERKEQGLAAKPDAHSLDNLAARRDPTGQELSDLDITVGTAANQTAVAPGELLDSWTRDGRRYFHYSATQIGEGYAIFSAGYAVRKARAGDVAIEIDYLPAHDLNVERMIRSMQSSLEQYARRFGPYPYRTLRMVEYSREDAGAHSASGAIWYSELFSQFDPGHDPRQIDVPFAVVAHEVAHQFQVAPARVEGRALLSESFAWYAALGVIEREYGAEHLGRFLDFMRYDYLNPRARADVPLLRASDWFVAYRKGPFAMYALREYVGQERVDRAWRRLREQHASGEPPYATSLDLLRELQAVTPDSLQYLLHDLLEANTFWELKTRQADAEQIPGGAWRVSIDLDARKVVVDTAGRETNIPMNDWIEVGVFAPAGKDQASGRALYLEKQRIRTGSQTITVTVPSRPASAGIDPRHLLIDVQTDDNDVPVKIVGGGSLGR